MGPIIIGIDPGTTSAFAVLNLEREVLAVKSRRNYSFDGLLKEASSYGIPFIVAGDKKETPGFVKEFSQKTGAMVFAPKYDTKKEEKKYLVKKYLLEKSVSNAHETDALASALFAYEEFRPHMVKIRATLEKIGKADQFEKVVVQVISENISVQNALARLEEKPDVILKAKKIKHQHADAILQLKMKNLALERENETLGKRIAFLEEVISREKNKEIDLATETKKMLAFKDSKISHLSRQLALTADHIKDIKSNQIKYQKFLSRMTNRIMLKKLNNLGRQEFESKSYLAIKEGDILLVHDSSIYSKEVVNMLKEKVRTIIYRTRCSKEIQGTFTLIPMQGLEIEEVGDYASVDGASLGQAIEKIEGTRFDKDFITTLVKDYKRGREIIG